MNGVAGIVWGGPGPPIIGAGVIEGWERVNDGRGAWGAWAENDGVRF